MTDIEEAETQLQPRPRRRWRRFWLATAGALTAATLAAFAGHSVVPARGAAPTITPRLVPTATRTPAARPTPVPIPKAAAFLAGVGPRPPIELDVLSLDGAWPLGLFVLDVRDRAIELGILNEASQPLTVAAAAQYKEAVSLFTDEHWKGLFYIGFRTAAEQDLLPASGGGAADLPPGVWTQVHFEVDLPAGDSLAYLRLAAANRQAMTAHELSTAGLKPAGQPWAEPGAAPTPVSVSTVQPSPSPTAKP